MLKQRVITAAVLLALLLPALFAASPWPFAVLTLLMVGAAGWEWGRLNSASPALSIVIGVVLAAACGLALAGLRRVGAGRWRCPAGRAAGLARPAACRTVVARSGPVVDGVVGFGQCQSRWHPVSSVSFCIGVGGRHLGLFRRQSLWPAPTRTGHQPGQKLGRRLERNGRCASAGGRLDLRRSRHADDFT